jgi:nucleoid DNA-binding protein
MAKKQSKSGKPRSKSQIYSDIAQDTGLSRKQVALVFENMAELIKQDLSKKGPGVFSIPGLLKIKVRTRPATKARKGINPFTGEETIFKAKPARRVVKAAAMKALKDMV